MLPAAPVAVVSPAPDHVALTLYRDPARGRFQSLDRDDPGGFALVTETRTVRVPAGAVTVRFEGVADGIVPVSAVIAGLPGGTIEKNRDARLLSPASLVDGTLGRRVTLTRTDKASGKVVAEEATIVAGPADGVVVRTASGVEALGCSGLGEGLRYGAVPPGLSAKPTLSVRIRSPHAATARVTLSYLASGFDWSASYVATIAPDGVSLGLFAWATLANANAARFADADVAAVAGRLERQPLARMPAEAGALSLACYPLGTTTSDLPAAAADTIVVTASRRYRLAAMAAPAAPPPPPPPPPEDLGDLKLYRVPMPVTVAANAQKQVALLVQPKVRVTRGYRFAVAPRARIASRNAEIVLEARNEAAAGLGVPLPAGTTALYAARGGDRLLLGLGTMDDTATGGRVRIAAGTSARVLLAQVPLPDKAARVTLSNANVSPVAVCVAIGRAGERIAGDGLERVDGVATWTVTVPANGTAELVYRYL